MQTYIHGNFPVFEGFNHMQYGIAESAWNRRHLAVDHNRRDTQYDHGYLLFYEIQKNME